MLVGAGAKEDCISAVVLVDGLGHSVVLVVVETQLLVLLDDGIKDAVFPGQIVEITLTIVKVSVIVAVNVSVNVALSVSVVVTEETLVKVVETVKI